MAISNVNTVAAANISAINGVSKANISAINGVTASFGGGSTVDPNPKSLVFACGFECRQLGGVGQHWSAPTNFTIDTGTVRSGSGSLRANLSSNNAASTCVLAAQTVIVARFYIRFATLPSASQYLAWAGSVAARIGLAFQQSDSTLRVASGTTPTMGTSGFAVTTGVWYRVDLKLDQTPSAKTADAQINGSAVNQKTSSDAGAATTFNLGVAASATMDVYYDDVAISATGGDYPIGAGHVHHFIPVSDGTHNTGTAGNFKEGAAGSNITNATTTSFGLIDEVPLDDTTPDTNDYINLAADTGATTNYVEHVLGPASGISTPTLGPRGVEVIYGYHAASSSVGAHILKINDNGTEDAVQSFNAAGALSTRYARKHYTDPPSAATAWDADNDGADGDFRDLRIRFGYSNDGAPDQYLDCVMIEAEFSN